MFFDENEEYPLLATTLTPNHCLICGKEINYDMNCAKRVQGMIKNMVGSKISIDEEAYGDNELDTSNLDMKPIQDSNVTTSSDNVIKIDFGVKGASSNTTPASGKYIYDVALTGLEINCNLLSEYVKWKLIKNGEEISSGSLSPKYDHIEYFEE